MFSDGLWGGYLKYAYENSDFMQQVSQKGYEMAIYTNEYFVDEAYRGNILNYDEHLEQKCRFWYTFYTMSRCSKYRIAPICMKRLYKYYDSNISYLITKPESWDTGDDYPFYQNLVKDGLSLKPDTGKTGTFYFYHFFGPHGPCNMSEEMKMVPSGSITQLEQARADLKMIYEYIRQLKELKKYDDAEIIITADHGLQLDNEYYLNEGIIDRTTIPLIMVKYPNKRNDKMQINESPVSQANFIPTILEAMGIDHKKYGMTFEEVPLNDSSERYYMDVKKSLRDLEREYTEDDIFKFQITGDARIKENWAMIE